MQDRSEEKTLRAWPERELLYEIVLFCWCVAFFFFSFFFQVSFPLESPASIYCSLSPSLSLSHRRENISERERERSLCLELSRTLGVSLHGFVYSCIMYVNVCNVPWVCRIVLFFDLLVPSFPPPLSFVLSFFGVHPPLWELGPSASSLQKVNPLRGCNTSLKIVYSQILADSCSGLEEETNVTYCSTAQVCPYYVHT